LLPGSMNAFSVRGYCWALPIAHENAVRWFRATDSLDELLASPSA
jgi:hypothetical protein